MKISLGTWSFSFGPFLDNPVPLAEVAARAAEAGYDGIELCGYPPHVTISAYPTKASRQELLRFLSDLGLGVSGYSSDFTSVNPVTEGKKQAYLELLKRYVELCSDLGCPAIRIDTVTAPGGIREEEYQASLDRLAEVWHAAAALASAGGVRLVWEYEPGFVFNKFSEVVAIHDKVAHPNFRLVFDTSHAYTLSVEGARQHGPKETLKGGVLELLDRLHPRIGAVHLIDSNGTLYGDETSAHVPFGKGLIDFQPLVPRLLALKDVEWWCVDLCFCRDAWDLVEPSRQFVMGLLENVG